MIQLSRGDIMEIIEYNKAEKGQNSDNCKVIEYSFNDKDIDLGVATIKGRYPASGYGMNLVSKELVYVIEGSGVLICEDKKVEFSEGDTILLQPNEKYYFETQYCKIAMACTPEWSKEQYRMVE